MQIDDYILSMLVNEVSWEYFDKIKMKWPKWTKVESINIKMDILKL